MKNEEQAHQKKPLIPDRQEGKKLLALIERDGRTTRELAKLLLVDHTYLSRNRISKVRMLQTELATNAEKVFGLPTGYFSRSEIPENMTPLAPDLRENLYDAIMKRFDDLEAKIDKLK